MNEDTKALKDSGERQKFDSGAVRDLQTGKGRYDLLPAHAIFRMARVYEKGAVKYEARNWEKGIPAMRFLDSALRHILQYMGGDQSEDHIAQALWNIAGHIETVHWIETGELPASLDDRPARMKPKIDKAHTPYTVCGCTSFEQHQGLCQLVLITPNKPPQPVKKE